MYSTTVKKKIKQKTTKKLAELREKEEREGEALIVCIKFGIIVFIEDVCIKFGIICLH